MRSPQCHGSSRPPAGRGAGAGRREASGRPESGALARFAGTLIAGLLAAGALSACGDQAPTDRFDADRAFELIEAQVEVGPRPAGSEALKKLGSELLGELPNVKTQPLGGGLRNLIGVIPGRAPAILVGAHYDTEATVPSFVGANDGAAGTAAVVELARAIERELPEDHREIRFVLFDGEEEPPGCPPAKFLRCGLRGSKAYANAYGAEIGEVIVLDYIANRGLRIPRETNSDPGLWGMLRDAAGAVGAGEFFPDEEQAPIVDDHVPFITRGVPAIDLIDFAYPFRDTPQDTVDKLDPAALDAVGETVAELVVRLSQ